jgi:hypothetical protein
MDVLHRVFSRCPNRHRPRRHRRHSTAGVWVAGVGSVAALFLACCGCLAGSRVIEGLMMR